MRLRVFTDGGARGNPGPAGIGIVIREAGDHRTPSRSLSGRGGETAGRLLEAFGDYLGETTNNQAEYRAMIAALERAKELGATEVEAFADSELLVKQLHRVYKVKNPGLAPLFVRVWNLAQSFTSCTFRHVPRERNREADRMVNAAIDRRGRV